MTEITTRKVDVSLSPRTFVVDITDGAFPHASFKAEFSVSCSVVTRADLSLRFTSAKLEFVTKCTSSGTDTSIPNTTSTKAGVFSEEDKNKPTTLVAFPKDAPIVKTRKFPFSSPTRLKSMRTPMPQLNIASQRSNAMDGRPQMREMINLRYLTYPQISEFIRTIAEEHGLNYTDVQLVGIFDPIPLHLVSSMVLDSITGKLMFHVRDNKKAERRFVRIAYARVRATGRLVQSNFPVM